MADYVTKEALIIAAGGDERIRAAMSSLAAGSDAGTRLDDMIASASGYIDGYLSEGGYTTPVVFADIADATQRNRFEKLLADVCTAIVMGRINPASTRGVGRGTEKNADWAQAWLDRVAKGLAIPGLPVRSRARIRVVGDNEPALPSSLFETYRAL